MKNKNFFYLVCALILGFGLYVIVPNRQATGSGQLSNVTAKTKEIRYTGRDGATALTLLKELNKVETKKTDLGEYVIAINGVAAGENQFWAFYVNGQLSTVGADSYTTTNADEIVWKLQKF